MSGQLSYSSATPQGVAGGIYDQSHYTIDSRMNEGLEGSMKFGMGVVVGSAAGSNVDLPTEDSTEFEFEGIAVNSHTQQMDLEGKVVIPTGVTVGVMKSGRVWGRIMEDVTPTYGQHAYLVRSGDYAGYFTNEDNAGDEALLLTKARYIGTRNEGGLAAIELAY